MMYSKTSIQPVRIIDPVCSCGNEIGYLQHDIEFKMILKSDYGKKITSDIDLSDILNDIGIFRMCCRKTIILSPILRLLKSGPTLKVYNFKSNEYITGFSSKLKVDPDE